MNLEKTANEFVTLYYSNLDDPSKRPTLKDLYTDKSMMTWEGTGILGKTNIFEKLTSMPKMTLQPQTTDVQPSSLESPNNMLVSVKGLLRLEENPPMQFQQVFQLIFEPNSKTYYILNDIFRLILN